MEFGILGPLQVVDDDRDLTPGRAKQRALLAILLLHSNDVVGSDQLVEGLWGETAPATAHTALHGHISALRKLLGSERIETHPPGYRLHVDNGELDLTRFEALAEQARRQLEPEKRSQLLWKALSLWRGELLADLRYESFAQEEIARIAELRVAVLEERIDADLAKGSHHELVGELESIVAVHPFRERVRGQLMLALYRSGRQAEALHVFQEGRRALVEELGINPGPALQRLQEQILNQDPSLDVPGREQTPEEVGVVPVDGATDPGGRPELREERKLATILFAEVSGSAPHGESLDPERLRGLVRAYFEVLSDVIATWGGTLEKYIGDAVVAVFGVPAVREDDAERALWASLEMLDQLEVLNRTFDERHGITLALRIGVDTGEVIVPRDRESGEQLVTGDAVSVAARLQQVTDPGTILTGDRTHRITHRIFRFGEPVTLDWKDKDGPAIAHPLLETLPISESGRTVLATPFVGRERELTRLADLLDEVLVTRTPRSVLVYGSAGIGKSRLTREFLALARGRHPEIGVLKGRCLAAGRGVTYWAFGEILRETFGITLDDAVETAGERLRVGARAILRGLKLSDEEVDRTVSALATTAGIALPDNPFDRMEPRAVADELARAWPRFATALAIERPTILVIEDLHWAGEPLLSMLERLTGRAAGPLLMVATARPEFAEAYPGYGAGREGATSISLSPLRDKEAAALIAGLLHSAELPEEQRDEILRMAEGNPFFLEEIILRLIDTGAIVRDGNWWRVSTDAALTSLPDSVHSLLAARVDTLPAGDKRVLQEASVVGRVFWEGPLVRALGEAVVHPGLSRLEDRGLIAARPASSLSGQAEFQFKHALVRDVAYSGLPKSRRARAHAQYASWLEELAGERLDEIVELVAYHYRSAVAGEDADLAWEEDAPEYERLRARSFEALVSAGDLARRRFAIAKALEMHDQALALAADDVERGRALAASGDDHEANFHGDPAFAAYMAALDLLRRQPGTESLRARICLMASRMAAVKWGGFRTEPTPAAMERLVDEGLEVETDQETRNWLTVLKGNVGLRWVWSHLEDPLPLSERIGFAKVGVEVAEALDIPPLLSQAYRTYGLLQSMAGAWSVTEEIARRDLQLADRLESTEQAFALFWNALFLMEIAGEFTEGVVHADRSLEVARTLTPHELMHGTYTAMSARFHVGRWTELELLAGDHLDALAQEPGVGCPYCRGGPVVAALVFAHQGRLHRAAELVATLTPDLDKPGLPEALLARYLVAIGDARAGRKLAERIVGRSIYAEENAFEILALLEALIEYEDWDALTAFLPDARRSSEALALIGPASDRAEGLARGASGDLAAAEKLLRRALAAFERMGVAFEAALTKERLGAVTPEADSVRLRREALAVYEQLQATPHLERLRAILPRQAGRP
jgi:DNA-binding SARP family transcriptional activator/class 3 adenylate cyclase